MRSAFVLLVALGACSDPGAAIEITDARAVRQSDRRLAVELELLAREGLGANVGTYCARVTFVGPTDPREQCYADLEDGDTKTVRLVSDGDVVAGSAIAIRVRLGTTDVGRSLATPP